MKLFFSLIVALYCTGSKRSNGSNEIRIQGNNYPFEPFEALNLGFRISTYFILFGVDTRSFEPFQRFERQQTQLK